MSLFNKIFTRPSTDDDEPLHKQHEDLARAPMFAMGLAQVGPDCDQLPNAYGEFGTTVTNPIPVNGPIGETIYLNNLRSSTGVGFFYHRKGSATSPVSANPIDIFELISIDASQRAILYFSMYHPRRSRKVPVGFSRRPWSSLKDHEKVLCKLDCFGVSHGPVNNFPIGLPDMIEQSKTLSAISPGLANAMANRIRGILERHHGKW